MIRGWLLVLCVLLMVWEPLSLGLLASSMLPAILDRPAALAILAVRVIVTGVGVAAGLALWQLRPHGVILAKASLVLSTFTGLLILGTAYVPSNRRPDTAALPAVLIVAYNGAWFAYLQRSVRVQRTYGV